MSDLDDDPDSILDDDGENLTADGDTDDDSEDNFYDDDDDVAPVLGVQTNEYVCERCFLVVHRSCGNGSVCADCLDG